MFLILDYLWDVLPMQRSDVAVLRELQSDCRQSIGTLAQKVGMSSSACHRRIKHLEESGHITGYGARLDGEALGFTMEFQIEVTLSAQNSKALLAFEEAVANVPEILECHLMTGQDDYVMRIAAKDSQDYERLHREKIANLPGVTRIQSSLILRTVKSNAGYPLA